jgi:hypothetical protein
MEREEELWNLWGIFSQRVLAGIVAKEKKKKIILLSPFIVAQSIENRSKPIVLWQTAILVMKKTREKNFISF